MTLPKRNVKSRLIAALTVLLLSVPTASFANKLAQTLAGTEARGLSGISSTRLNAMSIAPSDLVVKASAGGDTKDVVFSRAWLAAQPRATGSAQFKCLAEALYFEARGETVKGQFAVAEVIRNRVESSRFPNTYCSVINQGTGRKHQCQFSYTCDGYPEIVREKAAYERVAKVARAVLDDRAPDITHGATFYHTTAVRPSWSRKFVNTARFGVHLFYRRGVRTASN